MTRPVALVTGASSGIGLAFARALAARGHDLVIVARDTGRLRQVADEVTTDVEVLTADLTDPAALATVERRVRDGQRPVDLLVNNAGFGITGRFADLSADDDARQIGLNVAALTRLSHAALPGMVARGRGGIIQVSSMAGFLPAAGTATYAATKAFVTSLGLALRDEARGTGVKVLTLCPGFTRTEFQERANYDARRLPGLLWQTPEQVVSEALAAYDRDRGLCVPGFPNKAGHLAVRLLPGSLTRWGARMFSGHG